MKNKIFKLIVLFVVATIMITSCSKDLDRYPANQVFKDSVYNTSAGYKMALANVYGGYTVTGTSGAGSSDIAGVDAGTSDFVRCLWNVQELTTDEAVCAWNDPGVPDFHNLNWNASNPILTGLYARSLYQIALCNDFITHCNTSNYVAHGFSASDTNLISKYKAEARFLRAYQYSILMDAFANPPFATETTTVGVLSFPTQIKRADLFKYIESELLACSNNLVAPRQNEYGRADQAAAWALLSRIYLNAGVYTGTTRYTDAITYSSKVINNGGYSLLSDYSNLFKADNNLNNSEVILAIPYDGLNTQNYGGTTFLINSSCTNSKYDPVTKTGYNMSSSDYGVPNGGWSGNRSTAGLTNLFPTPDNTIDKRGLFLNKQGVTNQVSSIAQFNQGVPVIKFTNLTSTGVQAEPDAGGTFASTDFPLFRLAEQYLIYAEAVLQGGSGGDNSTALNYVNLLRQRAYGNNSGNFGSLKLSDIIDERGRELFWECFRRTDLIRFNKFTTGAYLWPWKGGVSNGTSVSDIYNIFPIPNTDLQANSNLKQNIGY